MDVSFTNVLEGARQYFQGLPVPSTGGGAASVDHGLATSSTNSASPTSATTHDHGASSQPVGVQATQSISTSTGGGGAGNNIQEPSRYTADVRPSSVESGATSSGTFWNPHVEPYPPQPTKVEVPDTRPGDEGAAMEPSSSSTVTLTEMQPSNHQSSSATSSSSAAAAASSTNNYSQRPPTSSASSSSSGDHHHHQSTSSSQLQHMQPPQPAHSPGPVYQQLNSVSRTSFTAAEMLASSHTPTYQTVNCDRPQSQPIVAQRTQYYPRYHHPDITKSAPAPFSQSSIYQSANVAPASASAIQQPSTRPTPVEQSNAQSHCVPEQRLPGTYGNVPPSQSPLGGSAVYGSSDSSQSYRMGQQHHQSIRLAASASIGDRSHNSDVAHSSIAAASASSTTTTSTTTTSVSYTSSPVCSSANPSASPRQLGGGSSSGHIPSSQSQNLPGHIPSPHHLPSASSAHHHTPQHQPSHLQQHHPSRINPSPLNPSYGGRSLPTPHGASPSSSVGSSHSQQMPPPPPTNLSGYHSAGVATPSPHESSTHHATPSPHHATPSPHHATPSPHHATPSPHRQSPHVSSLHNNPHASPHHTPSPHSGFQPHSPTYPPPPQPQPPSASNSRSTHPYNLPVTSQQHYQTAAAYGSNPYAPPSSSYHSFQKTPPQQSQSSYYSQPGRSHAQSYSMQQMLAPPAQTVYPGGTSLGYQQSSKHVTYNGADAKRSAMDVAVPYASHRSPAVQRSSNTHNLPPIAALSSYHSNRSREPLGAKSAQSVQRQQQRAHPGSGASNNAKIPGAIPPSAAAAAASSISAMHHPQRIVEYPVTPAVMNHAIPVNGRTTTVTNLSYSSSRYATGQQQQSYPSYATTMAPSHHGNSNSTSGTAVTSIGGTGTTTITARSSAVPAGAIHAAYQSSDETDRPAGSSSSYHHHHQPSARTTESYAYKEYPYQSSSASSSGQPGPTAAGGGVIASSPSSNSNAVRKRESPLDLSVKTVKTSADSTAQDDLEATSTDKHVSSSNLSTSRSNVISGRSMPPPQPLYPSAYDPRPSSNSGNMRSSSMSCVRASTPQAVCAPKVDFLPDFNSAPLRHHHQPHENALRRTAAQQQLYVPPAQQPPSHHANNNTAPLPHMSTFKKRPLPTTQLYDSLSIPPPLPPSSASATSSTSSSSSSYLQPSNDSMPPSRFSKYPPMVDRVGSAALPAQDYPHDPATKYYLDSKAKQLGQQYLPRERAPFKRLGEPLHGGPSKQPRLAWPMTADKPIEQKLSNALNEQQKRQEMGLPVPLPNGALMTPAAYEQRPDSGYSTPESSRYQQAYCDKRSYPDSKVVRSSPTSYGHPVISKPPNVHSTPQHLSAAQPTYSSYRQASQKTTCPPVGTSGGQPMDQPSNTGADKRVLNLLRNSLENKQQREEQLNSQQPILVNHSQQSFQNKVVAPVEPKTNIGRHNLSPFTAANLLERNSNTPPHYKFHMPRAVDSITQEAAPRSLYVSRLNTSATLPGKEALLGPRGAENQIHRDKDDGLAAILAAKIRTKAELKQVGTGHFATKAPLLPPQDASPTSKATDSAASTSTPQSGSSAGSPPKLTREKTTCVPPRRRLFSRTEDDNMPVAATVPAAAAAAAAATATANTGTVPSTVPARASGCRSSSETSVFDFRESDSEGEMPVLERQTLEEMRRDRKQLSKVQPPIPLNDAVCMNTSTDLVKIELKENDKINEVDPFWTTTCDKFIEQLSRRDSRKRSRIQILGGSASSKLDDTAIDSDRDSDTNNTSSQPQIRPENIKKEPFGDLGGQDKDESSKIKENFKVKVEPELIKNDDKHSSDDSDEVPLIKRATRHKVLKKEDSDGDEEVICRKRRVRRGSRIKLVSSSGSESSSEDSDGSTEFGRGSSVADRLRARKRSMNNTSESEGMKLRSRDTTPHKANNPEPKLSPPKGGPSQKRKPKPLFGDGSDFRPGWEEEVYVYKKSLRMPTRLITVSKPSRFHRLSTSLPDLDPGSPALSVSMDSSDVCLSRKKLIDSDMESNYSFSIAGKIDDEEATSSTTVSCPPKAMKHSRSENSSIVDVLAQKVGSDKLDSRRKLSPKSGKIALNKSSGNEPELLPTPSLAPLLSSETSKSSRSRSPLKNNKSTLRVTDSNLLGYFRKETVNNFRDAFKNNHTLPNEFSTLVLKSRTRTETKVLKKEATIREVFGEDRPASAPPMQNREDTSQDDDSQNETMESALGKARSLKQRLVSRLKNTSIQRSRKAIVNKAMAERRKDLLKSIADKTLRRIKTELEEETVQEETNDAREEENNEMEDDKNDPEAPGKKRLKLRTSRRKFRSGFDYIRKKKKPMKRDETLPKEKKRQVLPRPNPECVGDIQSEIRTWVIKKGVGETILHRAARLGYTDVAAYCLEKLNNIASPKDNAGYTPLHEACSKGHLEIAKLLLAYGANVSESANGGIRPLHEAAENGATELVRLLLSYGADPLLATYSGQTPLMLAVDTEAHSILEQHLDDVQGCATVPWSFSASKAAGVDSEETGCDPLDEVPLGSPEANLDDVEMEVSDINLPALFTLKNDSDKWVLLHDLMAILKVKSRDALLRQINPKAHSGPPAVAHREVMRELKLPDFLEQTRCCHLLSGGEKINVRGSKVTLIKYNDKVKSLLNVEKLLISLR